MTDKEAYEQKIQAKLDEWTADVDKLKARAASTGADAQIELNKQIAALEGRIDRGRGQLNEIAAASDEAWESLRVGMESAWDTLKTAAGDAAEKFKK